MSTVSMSEIARGLREAENLLNRTVEDALSKGFKVDADFKDELAPYMRDWGKRTVHDFMVFCVNNDAMHVPNLQAGQMWPYNFFYVLWPLYVGCDR